ncbi:phage tail tube protein [Streptomyces noursei]|uniref:phage tail tube protein n=1 Tax=Streptomyces noursei TaxID=1971 RepID=UPI0038146945
MPHSSNLSFLGIAKEATLGTPVAATAFIPVEKPTPKDVLTLLQDKGLRGSMVEVYNEISGPKHSTFDFGGDVFPDTIGWMLAGTLGDLVTTGASAPYTHAVAVLNTSDGQPKSYTLTDYYATGTRQYAGAKFSELVFKFNGDSMLTYSAKATAFASATTTVPTPSFTAIPPIAAWTGVVQIGGTTVSTVLDGEVTIKRPVTVIQPVAGSQNPANLWSGPVSVDGKLTLVMEDDTQLTNYLNNSQPSLDINFAAGSGTTAIQVKLHMTNVVYSAADIGRGKDYVELAVAFNARANTTDIGTSGGYSPIKATIQNAITSGTYA